MKEHRPESPTPSCSSADEALFELLGLSEISTKEEVAECKDPSSTDFVSASSIRQVSRPTIQKLTPPANCLRPHTPHSALLLLFHRALSPSQCSYIIDRGYQVSNDGGKHYGPTYIREAAHTSNDDSMVVKLQKPNHHKVCVFKDETVLTWLKRLLVQDIEAHEYIRDWWYHHNKHDKSLDEFTPEKHYIINPRLRLLRYDAVHDDEFVPHYDAVTTTQGGNNNNQQYTSKLTTLCYLNDSDSFCGGETLFLDAIDNTSFLPIQPVTGNIAIFNHELYHSSNRLQYNERFRVKRPTVCSETTVGGTKFVLRSDVMFQYSNNDKGDEDMTTVPSSSTTDTTARISATLSDVMETIHFSESQRNTLLELFGNVSTRAFMVPGREQLIAMLLDVGGLNIADCVRLLVACEASLVAIES